MRPAAHVTATAGAKRQWRSFQLSAAASLVLLSCSVYDSSLLVSGSDALQDSGAGTAGALLSAGAPAMNEGAGQAGTGSEPPGGASSGGTGGDAETGGGSVIVTYGGAAGSDASSGGASSGSGGSATAGGAGASSAGAAGGSPTIQELGKKKSATASSTQTGNEPAKGNDGDSATRWCAVSSMFPQWWRVDLGATHQLTQIVVKFEHPERTYYYVIETSPNDAVWTQRAMVSGTGDTQTVDMPANVSARYVRITVTGAAPYMDANGTYSTWASFWEMRLYGI